MRKKIANFSNLREMLEKNASKYGKRIALVFGRRKVSYSQVLDTSQRVAQVLSNLGIGKSDKVCIWLPNVPEFVYSFFGIIIAGGIVCPINSMFKREEAKFVIEDSGTKVLITSIDKLEEAENILWRLDSLKFIICVSSSKHQSNILDFYSLVNTKEPLKKEIPIHPEDIAEIIYTSGTTGRPKGTLLTHKNLLSNIRGCGEVIKITKRDCFICILPLFHSFASTVCMLLPLSCGAKIVIMRAVRPFKRVIRAIFKNRITIFVGIPSVFNILSELKIPKYKLFLSYLLNPVRLCISGAASLPSYVLKKFESKFRIPLLEGYGLTEASPVVSLNPLKGKRIPGSVGLPLPSVQVKVVDKGGRPLPPNQIGELLIKGDNIMKGYYKLEEETKQVLREGWLHTGDLAKLDDEGYIYIMGRIKEMINVRGLNVYPKEIENLLYKHPKVKEVACVGVPHSRRGEVPLVFIVKKEKNLSTQEILEYLRANLASYKVPLKVIFKDSFPKSPSGKILKRELQKEVIDIFR